MNNTMINRGPNDGGEIILDFKNAHIGLEHRRLSIQDLSSKGHQPLFSNEKDAVIVFNGEIYNFLDLRKELKNHMTLKAIVIQK